VPLFLAATLLCNNACVTQDGIDAFMPPGDSPAAELTTPLDDSAAVGTHLIGTHFPSAAPELEPDAQDDGEITVKMEQMAHAIDTLHHMVTPEHTDQCHSRHNVVRSSRLVAAWAGSYTLPSKPRRNMRL
jgi:hypothetical protein